MSENEKGAVLQMMASLGEIEKAKAEGYLMGLAAASIRNEKEATEDDQADDLGGDPGE